MANKGISVGVEIKGDAKGFKSAAADAQRATENLRKKAQEHSAGISSSFKDIAMAAGGIGLSLGALKGAFDIFKKVVDSSDTTADAWEKTTKRMETSVGTFYQTLASGDWLKFFSNLQKGIKLSDELVEAQDRLTDRRTADIRLTADESDKLIDLELIFRNKLKSAQERQTAIEQYDTIIKSASDRRIKNSELEYDNSVKLLAKESHLTQEFVKNGIKLYDDYAANNIAGFEETSSALESTFKVATTNANMAGMSWEKALNGNYWDEAIGKNRALTQTEKDVLNVMLFLGKTTEDNRLLSANAYKDLVGSQRAAREAEKETLKMRTSISTSMDKEVTGEKKKTDELEKQNRLVNEQMQLYNRYRSFQDLLPMNGSTTIANPVYKGKISRPNAIDFEGMNKIGEKIDNREFDIQMENEKKLQDAKEKGLHAIEAASMEMFNNIFNLQMAKNNEKMNKELAAVEGNEAASAAIRRKYAKKNQRIAILQANIQTALSVTKAFADYAWPFSLVVGGIMAAAGAAQIATIKSQAFAKGGIVSGPVLATVGEYAGAKTNPEVIAPLSKLKGMLGTGGGVVRFEIEGTTLAGVLRNYSRKTNSFS
jgi:hypothetical protein